MAVRGLVSGRKPKQQGFSPPEAPKEQKGFSFTKLIVRHLFQLLSISREYLRLGNKTDICTILLDYRQVPGLSLFEFLHNAVHLLIDIDIRRR